VPESAGLTSRPARLRRAGSPATKGGGHTAPDAATSPGKPPYAGHHCHSGEPGRRARSRRGPLRRPNGETRHAIRGGMVTCRAVPQPISWKVADDRRGTGQVLRRPRADRPTLASPRDWSALAAPRPPGCLRSCGRTGLVEQPTADRRGDVGGHRSTMPPTSATMV
jgi:hypothetical protein